MTSLKSILPMMILIILSFFTPTRPMFPSSSNPDGQFIDYITCYHNLKEKCGSRNATPTAENCVSKAFLFWDENIFADVTNERVQGVLKEYYESFGQNILRSNLLGPRAYCDFMEPNEINREQCNLQLLEFKNGPDGPDGPEGPNYFTVVKIPLGLNIDDEADINEDEDIDAIMERIQNMTNDSNDEVQYPGYGFDYGDEASPAIRFGLYKTKFTKYVNMPNANVHNIDEIIYERSFLPYVNASNKYSVDYMIFISNIFQLKKDAVKDPKHYCITKFSSNA